jgi:hypothetical protein
MRSITHELSYKQVAEMTGESKTTLFRQATYYPARYLAKIQALTARQAANPGATGPLENDPCAGLDLSRAPAKKNAPEQPEAQPERKPEQPEPKTGRLCSLGSHLELSSFPATGLRSKGPRQPTSSRGLILTRVKIREKSFDNVAQVCIKRLSHAHD